MPRPKEKSRWLRAREGRKERASSTGRTALAAVLTQNCIKLLRLSPFLLNEKAIPAAKGSVLGITELHTGIKKGHEEGWLCHWTPPLSINPG